MKKDALFVLETHMLNGLFLSLMSLFYDVKTFKFTYISKRIFPRIKLVHLKEYINQQRSCSLRAETARLWDEVLPQFPNARWDLRIGDKNIDLSRKARQVLSAEFERLIFIKYIADQYRLQAGRNVYIVDSWYIDYIKKAVDSALRQKIFDYPAQGVFTFFNVFCDRLHYWLFKIIFALKHIKQAFKKQHMVVPGNGRIKYIYDHIAPSECSADSENLTFTWIVDGHQIKKEEILFVLPRVDSKLCAYAYEEYTKRRLCVVKEDELVRIAPLSLKVRYIASMVSSIAVNLFIFTFEKMQKHEYYMRILPWKAIAAYLRPKVYLSSLSQLNIENPAIEYLNAIGISTVIWIYGTSSSRFTSEGRDEGFKTVRRYDILCEHLVVWNKEAKDFTAMHYQQNLDVKVIGPLMCGNENVMQEPREKIFNALSLLYKPEYKYISVFDCASFPKGYKVNKTYYHDLETLHYHEALIRNIQRLLNEFQDICFIFKPKRSAIETYSLLPQASKHIEGLMKSDRFLSLKPDVNPWLPISMADLCISVPFESPNIAALHYGKPVIFHSELNTGCYHRYAKVKNLITYDFEQLRGLVEKFLFHPESFKDMFNKMDFSDFVGDEPRTNSSMKFREFLKELA